MRRWGYHANIFKQSRAAPNQYQSQSQIRNLFALLEEAIDLASLGINVNVEVAGAVGRPGMVWMSAASAYK